MIRTLALIVLTILSMSSCTHSQSFYAISGLGTIPLSGMQGEISWADGQPASSSGEIRGESSERLLTLIFLTPMARGNGSRGGDSDTGGSLATFELANGIFPDNVDARVEWDKRADVVKIDGNEFDRSKGTLFVIVKSPRSLGKVWQLTSPSGITDAKELLAHAKAELQDVEAVQDASLDLS
ncbi:hypothetical protein [Fimbriimonas ginsengisoli]|uniref:hypothetical protein n=1 Tax=Fimbriimonas ginsengisoli TaxID=1005039 RepID=UPI001186C529|nr:hypothetical protein [Fimbriimonas ginsengisoli]